MRIFNEEKTIELNMPDLDFSKGKLVEDTLIIPAKPFIEEQSHYEVIAEYPNGGKDIKKVVDVAGQVATPETQEPIYIYIPFTEQEQIDFDLRVLRDRREAECFSIINRGALWYNTLTEEQIAELQTWYQAWLDVTETKVIPEKPSWLN